MEGDLEVGEAVGGGVVNHKLPTRLYPPLQGFPATMKVAPTTLAPFECLSPLVRLPFVRHTAKAHRKEMKVLK